MERDPIKKIDMNYRNKIREYLKNSSLEKSPKGYPVNLFIYENAFDLIIFNSENFYLKFNDSDLLIVDRDANIRKSLTEVEFFICLDILVEIEVNKLKNISLRRKLRCDDEFKTHMRNCQIKNFLDD